MILFQAPVHYSDTVRQNIQFGALDEPFSAAELQAAAAAAGATEIIEQLPRGYDTMLGKWRAEGTELSTGQWQRLALARAFLRHSPIVLLDEPTSALDSWAENDWLRRFRTVMAGRTVILITHRFTTARQADAIHVMVGGRIVEAGTHQELLAQNGLYAQSWRAQTQAEGKIQDCLAKHRSLYSAASRFRSAQFNPRGQAAGLAEKERIVE